ncbi:MAG: DUF3499 family protein [Actinomycetota bacterium]
MFPSCVRCNTPASSLMTYSYSDRHLWVDDLHRNEDVSYPMCAVHADRLSPPIGWTLTDRRTVSRLFAPLEVA